MTQGTLYVTDANSARQGLEETVLADGNLAPNVVITDANSARVVLAPGAVGLPVQAEGLKAAYQYSVLGLAPVATPTDVLEIQGSATKTVRVRRIEITGVATAAGNMPVQLIRRSVADSGGGMARTGLTAFKPDTGYAAASAVVSTMGTANPGALGTQVGGIGAAGRACLSAAGSGLGVVPLKWEFDVNAAVLRGTADFLYLNMNGAALPAGAVFDITIYTQEDAS